MDKEIIFLIGSMDKGGAERVISILANDYAKRGWRVHILTLLKDSCKYELDKNIIVKSLANPNKSRICQIPSWVMGIRKYVKENNPSVVVSFIARINVLTIISCIGLNKKIVISERNDPYYDGRGKITDFCTFLFYPFADKIIFQTKWAKSYFPKYIQKKGGIIPNPIFIKQEASQDKKEKIVSVGRLAPQKNQKLLINAFAQIADRFPQYNLIIYGEGELRQELQEQIDSLHLTNRIILPGIRDDIHEEIKDAKLFVLSSNYEGLSNALLEAMLMGIPCITTNCSGIDEYIIHKHNGSIIPINNEQLLVEKMVEIIINQDYASQISANARKLYSIFNENTVVKAWNKIIE